MSKPILVVSGISILVTIFSVFAYLSFNILGITQNRTQRYELTIVTESVEKVYDGTPLTSTFWYIEKGQVVEGDTLQFTMESTITNVGMIDNEIGITILDSENMDVTGNYKITLKLGKLKVIPRGLYITTESLEKVYDGTPLESQRWTLTDGVLISNHRIEAIMTASITKPGTLNNQVGITILDQNDQIVTSNYNIFYDIGQLTVYPREIGIETFHVEKIYDGVELSSPNWRYTYGLMPDNHTIIAVMTASITNPGSIQNDIGITIVDENNQDVTDLYEIEYIIGSLVVLPRILSIQTDSADKVYDGRALSNPNYHILNGTLAPNHRIQTTMVARLVYPGTIQNEIGITILDQNDQIVTNRYQLDLILGSLTVFPRELHIQTDSQEKVYDGLALTSQNWSVGRGVLAEGHRLEVNMVASITDPGQIENSIGITIFDQDNAIVTNIYQITYDFGLLTVYLRPLQIQTETLEKYFDGSPLTSQVYTILSGSLAPTHRIEAIMVSSITNPGTIVNEIGLSILDETGNIMNSRYELGIFSGTLTVLPIHIQLRTESADKIYDGNPLTNPNYTIENGALAPNHRIEAVMPSSITTPGEILNEIGITIFDQNNVNVTIQYGLTINYGTLIVRPRTIQLETSSAFKTYDGSTLTNPNWTLTNGLLAANHRIEAIMSSSITNPGQIENSIGITILDNTDQIVTDHYQIIVNLGILTVHKKVLGIETPTAIKDYDGVPLFSQYITILEGNILFNERFEYTMPAQITLPGTIENTIQLAIFNDQNVNVTDFYDIYFSIGTLTVRPIEIHITTVGETKVYDSQPLFNQNWYYLQGSLLAGHRLEHNMPATITTPGSVDNTFYYQVFDQNNVLVNDIYRFIITTGQLTVTPRPLVIQTNTNEKIYDGQALNDFGWWFQQGNVLPNHRYEVMMHMSITNPGTIQNSVSITIYNEYNQIVTDYYDIQTILGTLTIHKRNIQVTTSPDAKVYDGTPLTNLNWWVSEGSLANNQWINPVMNASITTPGFVQNDINVVIYDLYGTDVTDFYNVYKDTGRLTVMKRDINIQTDGDSKEYDGMPLNNLNWRITNGSMVNNDRIEAIMASTITNPGSIQNTIGITIYSYNNQVVTEYYNLIFDLGTLTVERRAITIQSESDTRVYNGTPLTAPVWTLKQGTVLHQHTITGVMPASITTPGSVTNSVDIQIIDSNGVSVVDRYMIFYDLGNLTITQRPLTIQSDSQTRPYDGTPLTNSNWSILEGSVISSHYYEGFTTASIIYPGTIINSVNFSVYDQYGIDVTAYYKLTTQFGSLTIEKRQITIRTASDEKTYDGQPLFKFESEIMEGTLVGSDYISPFMSTTITNPGTVQNASQVSIYTQFGIDVSGYYQVNYQLGTLTVHKRNITIKTGSETKIYDDSILTNHESILDVGTLAFGHRIQYTMNASIQYPGSTQNTVNIQIYDLYDNIVTDYYNISYNLGTLTMLPRPITVHTGTTTRIYNGDVLTNYSWWYSNLAPLMHHTAQHSMYSAITDVGTIKNEMEMRILDFNNQDITHRYEITYVFGDLTITPKPVTFTSNSDQKEYDGLPLLNHAWDITSGGLIFNHYANPIMNTSITTPGTAINTMEIDIFDGQNRNVTHNYLIQIEAGELTVTPRILTIETDTVEKIYDGASLTSPVWRYISGSLLEGHQLMPTMYTQITTPGTVDNAILITIIDTNSRDITHYYQVNELLGSLTVHPKPLTIRTFGDSKVYDGFELRNYGWQVQQGSLISGHHFEYDMRTTITLPGEVENDISLTIVDQNAQIVTSYYDITYEYGLLVVTPRELVIETDSITQVYNGVELVGSGYSIVQGSLLDEHHMYAHMYARILTPGQVENSIGIIIYDQYSMDITDRYDINLIVGQLNITPRPLSIETESQEKVYDGLPLVWTQWRYISGNILPQHRIETIMSSSITNPGEIDNLIGITIYNNQNEIVTHYYDITLLLGSLTIHKRSVTVVTEDATHMYDGQIFMHDVWFIADGEFIVTHRIESNMSSSITNPGTVDNSLGIRLYDLQNRDVTDYYNITFVLGQLTVLERPLTIESIGNTKTYDGTPLVHQVHIIRQGTLVENHRIEVTMPYSITNPGEIENAMNITIYDAFNVDVTHRYDITEILGLLVINKRNITVRTDSLTRVYDGFEYSSGFWEVTFGSIIPSHLTIANLNNRIMYPGSIDNEIDLVIMDGQFNDVTAYYNITYALGKLTILPRSITIKTGSDEKLFDNSPLTNTTWSISSGTLVSGDTIHPSMNASITNPGTTDNVIGITITDYNEQFVTSYYDISFDLGELTVLPRVLNIVTEDAEKTYDGLPLSNPNWTLLSGTTISGHTIQTVMPSTITNPGTKQNLIGITILDASNQDVTHYYTIETTLGVLEVKPIVLILQSGSSTKVYDGAPLSNPNYTLVNGSVLPNHTLHVVIDGEITDIGSIDNLMFAYVLDALGNNVSHFYEFDEKYGKLTILTSSYGSGDLSTEGFEPSNAAAFKVFSPQAGTMYFKDTAWGSYKMTGWNMGMQHNTSITTNPHSFAPIALEEAGRSGINIQVEYLRDQMPYLLPYFTTDPISGLNDIRVFGSTSGTVQYNLIMYTYNRLSPISLQDSALQNQEQLYKQFVYNHYLSIPESTRLAMLDIIEDNNIDALSPSIITDVQTYIQNAATYNLDFDPIPAGVDIGIYFLTVSKEGICQHYATAATLMYRALGIPARYVTGYVAKVKSNQWVNITDQYSHAWVEIYLDGFGWLPVEVTGGGPSGSGSGGGTGGEPGDGGDGELRPVLTVTPRTIRELYLPGKVITATSVSIQGFSTYATQGYTYTVTFDGSLSEPGFTNSSVATFTIYNSIGVDVTDQFDINYNTGVLQMYQYEIELMTTSDYKEYDGTDLTSAFYSINGSLQAGHTIQSIVFTGAQKTVGTSKNRATLVIVDELGNNVTSLYNITNLFGDLVVTPRTIVIESGSSTRRFNGTPLVNPNYTIISGSLAPNQSIEVVITGSQTSIGSSINTIDSITITHNGVDVTINYIIEIEEGELIVRP